MIAENPVGFVVSTKVLIQITGLKSSVQTHPKHPKSCKPLKSVQESQPRIDRTCELRYHQRVLLYQT